MSFTRVNLTDVQLEMVRASAYGMNGAASDAFVSAVDARLGLVSYERFGASGPTTPQVAAAVTAELNKGK
jgi:hypothetical protein